MSEQQKEIKIEIDEQTANGLYINLALISHNETEFVLDFLFAQPQTAKAKVRSRIITSPSHTKRLLMALQDNVRKYEEKFGQIKIAAGPEDDKKVGFVM
ncbi:MAG: DUF3467 domain-containing protein [bacterium]